MWWHSVPDFQYIVSARRHRPLEPHVPQSPSPSREDSTNNREKSSGSIPFSGREKLFWSVLFFRQSNLPVSS